MSQRMNQNTASPFMIFPQWSDSELNNEKWDVQKKEVKTLFARKASLSPTPNQSVILEEQWNDPQNVPLPDSIAAQVSEWKRPEQLFRNVELVVTNNTLKAHDLRVANHHIMHSEFMRNFLSSICLLDYMSYVNPWKIEATNSQYVPNTEGHSWKPWHHVYSLCKAGKGYQHNPLFNKHGKYVVRLFWMGYWRKICVDDSIPIDQNGHVLLPSYKLVANPLASVSKVSRISQQSNPRVSLRDVKRKNSKGSIISKASNLSRDSKKRVELEMPQYELWPYIICKALLKIAALSWTKEEEVWDYSAITCLTGWIFQKLDTRYMSPKEIWNACEGYSPKFEWKEDLKVKKGQKSKPNIKIGKESKIKASSKKDKAKSSSKKGKGAKVEADLPEEEDTRRLYCLIGSCQDLKTLMKDVTLDNMPEDWCLDIFIEQSRDIPLSKPEPRPELARWKRFRWLKWAISKGIWPADDLSIPIRCLKFFSNLNRGPEFDTSAASLTSKKSKSKGNVKHLKTKDTKKKKGEVKVVSVVDKSLWVEFSDIQDHLKSLSVFFRPSEFNSVVRISDLFPVIDKSDTTKGKEKIKREIKVGNSWLDVGFRIHEFKNRYPLIIMNSLSPKLVLISLNNSGHVERIDRNPTLNTEESYAYVLVNEFCWESRNIGTMKSCIRTDGAKSILVHLKPGKTIFRINVRSTRNFVVTFMSNTLMSFGSIADVVDEISEESLLLRQKAQEVSEAFGKTVNSFGTPEFSQDSHVFHRSYKDNLPFTQQEKRAIYEDFAEILIEIIGDRGLIYALQVLFLDPNLDSARFARGHTEIVSLSSYGTFYRESLDSIERMDMEKLRNLAVLRLQAFSRFIYERRLYQLHKLSHPRYVDIYDKLKKIYDDYFSVSKRQQCLSILRNLYLKNPLLATTDLYADLRKTVECKVFNGAVVGQSWVFVSRQKFSVTSEKPVSIRYYIDCSSAAATMRVFNNDNMVEMERAINITPSNYYNKNQNGYTFLCYAHCNESVKISWKIIMFYLKQSTSPIFLTEDIAPITTLSKIYRPNVNNIVLRYILEAGPNTYVTLRLGTSGRNANLHLKLLDDNNRVIYKARGIQNIILPLAKVGIESVLATATTETLRQKKSRTHSLGKLRQMISRQKSLRVTPDTKRYYIEAVVEPNTWPLTASEWLTVKLENKKYLLFPPDSEPRIGPAYGTKALTFESDIKPDVKPMPYWQLSVIFGSNDEVTLREDTTRRDEINAMKSSWYAEDPDRRLRSIEIRENYLKDLCARAADYCNISREMECGSIISEHSIDSDVLMDRWIPETLMLPTFALCDYFGEECDDEPIYLPLSVLEFYLQEQAKEEALENSKAFSECNEAMERLLDEQVENFAHTRMWYDELRQDSAEMMKKAYAGRQKYIDMMTAVPPVEKKGAKKEKPTKKGKKKK